MKTYPSPNRNQIKIWTQLFQALLDISISPKAELLVQALPSRTG